MLTAAEVDDLLRVGGRRHHRRGAIVFHEGDRSDSVAYLERGRVKVSSFTRRGDEVVLAVHTPGQFLGELSAVDGEPRSATVSALDPVDVVVVTAAAFRAYLHDHPRVGFELLRLLSRRIRDADRKRVEFGAHDTSGRVASRLLELSERFGTVVDGGIAIELPVTQEELAGWVGASREGVSKALRGLRDRGVISTGRRRILVHDADALARLAG